ncbi:hypothetical protein [Saccharopolyspora phatthalungensis]|uniref:DNA primase n=1 Tax=Saccharopolyspora phatthalungensis TaxID=664693 RepID=A0A840QI75_9PSEU|nr:hypothetical protein [Saccharopolyspora phatthalungensis]MBB5158538.1 hypothetical protein [Saccharopolyspora phatthalungensis]
MKSGPHIALAVGIGYVLGRSRKMKLAIMVGAMMAGRRLPLDPRDLLAQGSKLLGGSPELKKLTDDARDRLLDAAKTAAIAAATNKIDSIGDNLTKRAAGLRVPRSPEQNLGKPLDEEPDQGEAEEGEPEQERPGSRVRGEARERRRTADTGVSGRRLKAGTAEPGGRATSRTRSGAAGRHESGTRSRSSRGD